MFYAIELFNIFWGFHEIKVCQWFETDLWFSTGPLVSSINKTDRHNITEILLKVALSTIKPNQTNPQNFNFSNFVYSGGCIYDKGSWESCDPVTNKRAKKKLLKSGDTKTCTAEKLVYRSCIRANGEGTSIFR